MGPRRAPARQGASAARRAQVLPRAPALTVALAALLALAGCGLGPGRSPSDIRLTVTRDFGAHTLLHTGAPRARGEETVMSLLMRNASITTRYGGGFVQSIDGLAGGHQGADAVDWFYYVNGVQASRGAAETIVHPGDRIWWDWHDWSQTETVPAVVGSFPQPFLSGVEGKRLPVRVECAQPFGQACRITLDRLRSYGVPAAVSAPSGAYSPQTLRVLVGAFPSISADPTAHGLEQGPRASGVYARFGVSGHSLTLLNARGRSTTTLGPGTGLVAATRYAEGAPVWLVTGTDNSGVVLAARALRESTLQGRFAVALVGARTLALPQEGP